MRKGNTSPVTVAQIYAMEGEWEKALDLLDKAAQYRDRRLLYVNVFPFFKGLRDQPRFAALLRKMKLA